MLRLILSIVIGALVGVGTAAFAIKVLGITWLVASTAYPLGIAVGILVGLLTGTPVWAPGAWLEAILKAVFGAVVACALMYAFRSWATVSLNLTSLGLGSGEAGKLPEVVLPTIALLLSVGFGIDSLFGAKSMEKKSRLRVKESEQTYDSQQQHASDSTENNEYAESFLDSDNDPFATSHKKNR